MSFLSVVTPNQTFYLQSRLKQQEIMERMHWLLYKSPGIPGSGGIRGALTGPNMFMLQSGLMEYGGVVEDFQIRLIVRMNPVKFTWLVACCGIGLLVSLVSVTMNDDAPGMALMCIGIYAVFVLVLKNKAGTIKRYLFQLLEAWIG